MPLRRKFAVFLGIASLLLAGCAGKSQPPAPAASSNATAPTAISAPMEPIILAGIIPISGTASPLGPGDKAAMELAAERMNAAGGILGRPIKVLFYDQQAAPDMLVQDMARDKVFAAAGFDSSDPAIRAIPEIMKQKMVLMVTGAGSTQITESVTKDPQANRYLFRNGNDAQAWAVPTAVFLRDIQKARSYFYLSQNNQFGKDMETAIANAVKPQGITSAGSFYFTRGSRADRDIEVLEGALSLIREKKPDVVVSYLGPTAFSFLKVYRDRQVPVPLYDIAANSIELEDKVKAELGASADFVALPLGTVDADITPLTRPFYQAFRTKAGTNPGGLFDVRAGDGIVLLAEAIREAGALDTDKVIAALERGTFTGAGGHYTFDASHQAKSGPGFLTGVVGQWQQGKLEVVWPDKNRTSDFATAGWWKRV